MTAVPQRFLSCLILLLWALLARSGSAQDAIAEAELKAAFLYNFTKFIEWPAEAFGEESLPFVLGVFGEEEFCASLRKALAEKKAYGHPIVVKKLEDISGAASCHALFFRVQDTKRMTQLNEIIKTRPILTVGESEQFLDFGGMFNLFFEDKQLRFQVNIAAAENARLSVSSKLLRLAKRVRRSSK